MACAENVKSPKNKKIICWDCKKELKVENQEIKDGRLLIYEKEGEKIVIFKCLDCYSKSQELKNYQPCEIYSRVVGYLRPVQQWNLGKQQEFKQRKEFKIKVEK